VSGNGVNGDWQPLVSLVRIPQLKGIRCLATPDKCALVGEKLYLINSISTDEGFTNPVEVPDGYIANALPIPRPKGKILYVKLRDNPGDVNTVVLPVVTAQ
jgi:hypothetical protein